MSRGSKPARPPVKPAAKIAPAKKQGPPAKKAPLARPIGLAEADHLPMKDRISRRVNEISPSGIRAFFEMVIGMPDVLSLGVGEPDFVTPRRFTERAERELDAGMTRYTSNYGLMELRELVADHTVKIGGPLYDPKKEILVTIGVSEAVDICLRAIIDPGDEVIMVDPCYVSYLPMVTMAGGVPVMVPTRMEEGFKLRPEALQAAVTPRTKAIILGYPSNPTGMTLSRSDLEAIAEIVRDNDLMVISDEIYDRLTYIGEHTVFSGLEGMKDRTIYMNGFSKAYAMTGWRVGYACGHPEIIEAMMKVHQYAIMCAPIMGQFAAIEALRYGWSEMERMVASYNARRRLIVDGLRKLGLEIADPEGAFYAFPSIRSTGLSSEEFCRRLLQEEKVVVVPGSAFGAQGEGHVRICYASSVETINAALRKIGELLKRLK
jgi:aminotransferase